MKNISYWKRLRSLKAGVLYEENWNVFLRWLEKNLLSKKGK